MNETLPAGVGSIVPTVPHPAPGAIGIPDWFGFGAYSGDTDKARLGSFTLSVYAFGTLLLVVGLIGLVLAAK